MIGQRDFWNWPIEISGCLEKGIAHFLKIGKFLAPATTINYEISRRSEECFSRLPIDNNHLLNYAGLPLFYDHNDPFDRLLVAQSLSKRLILLTADRKLPRYAEP